MPVLENASRRLLKATYAAIELDAKQSEQVSNAAAKVALARNLQLQPGEVETVRRANANGAPDVPDHVWSTMRSFEPQPVGPMMPGADVLSGIATKDLVAFGGSIAEYRSMRLAASEGLSDTPAAPAVDPATGGAVAAPPRAAAGADVATAAGLATTAFAALDTFTSQVKIAPIGRLHLERLEMTPAGVERGELVATVPLAPGETTSVIEKEWTVTSQEFESIVTDSLEEFSEKGVTEKSELAQATESQTKHSSQLDLDASVSGSYGFVTFSASSKFDAQSADQETRKDSRNHAIEVTRKASTRTRKEHKVTIKTTSVKGSEETTTRELTNPSETDAMRIDYFSLMRRWRVRLYRYGLRLTYDIAIPEPGAALRESNAELARLDALLSTPFAFGLDPGTITRDNYEHLAATYAAQVPPPPAAEQKLRVGGPVQVPKRDDHWYFFELEVDIPDGFAVSSIWLDAELSNVEDNKKIQPGAQDRFFDLFGVPAPWYGDGRLHTPGEASFVYDVSSYPGFLGGRTGPQKIVYRLQNIWEPAVTFDITMMPTPEAMAAWRFNVWKALRDAAAEAYYTGQQALAQQRDELRARLEGVDTLTLRREEREEIMKGVLHWLLGPAFDFMPKDVIKLFDADPTKREHGESFIGNKLAGVSSDGWTTMFRYEEMVKFIHHAIEWENVFYFLYPYFWDVPAAWDFVRTLDHPDPTRRSFLRAGSARVVLTIRSGYEAAFASFVELGEFGKLLPPDHPYLTIGEEVRAYDETNYPGIPPANPNGGADGDVDKAEKGILIGEWFEYTPTSGTDIGVTTKLAEIG